MIWRIYHYTPPESPETPPTSPEDPDAPEEEGDYFYFCLLYTSPGGLAGAVPPGGGQDKVPWRRRYRQSEKGAGAKEKAGIVDLGHGDVSFP